MYWKCNKCGEATREKPMHKNMSCSMCGQGRYQVIIECQACGKEFHPQRTSQIACCVEHGYELRRTGGKKGKHYEAAQRARVGVCTKCGATFRAVTDFEGRAQKYCSKECWSTRGRLKTALSAYLRTTAEYKAWRMAVFERDGFKCTNCGDDKSPIEAHHIKGQASYPELRHDIDNGTTLCRKCHKQTDNYGNKARWETLTGDKAVLLNG